MMNQCILLYWVPNQISHLLNVYTKMFSTYTLPNSSSCTLQLLFYLWACLVTRWLLSSCAESACVGQTMSVYLSCVAVCDMIVLVGGQLWRRWIRNLTGFDLASISRWYCATWLFIINSAYCISSYSLAGVAVERCFAITSPLKSWQIICKRTAYIYITIIDLMSTRYCSHIFYA